MEEQIKAQYRALIISTCFDCCHLDLDAGMCAKSNKEMPWPIIEIPDFCPLTKVWVGKIEDRPTNQLASRHKEIK